MAKKPKESGPGVFMILVLVFFVLAAVVLGITTYLGFDGQTQLQAKTDEAVAAKKKLEERVTEETARKVVNKIAMGHATAEDREALAGAAKAHSAAILDEYNQIMTRLGGAAFPTKNAFDWPLMNELGKGGGDGENRPAPQPRNDVAAIAKMWAKMFTDMRGKYDGEVAARRKAEGDSRAAQDSTDKAKETFDQKVAELAAQVKAKVEAMDAAFLALKSEADKAGINFKKQADEWADARKQLEDALAERKQQLAIKDDQIKRLQNPDPSDILRRFEQLNIAKLSERMGTVTEKSETFVTVRFATRMDLVPGQTFVVIPSTGSLVEVLEKEAALEKRHHEFGGLGPRDPFADNEFIKGTIEITEVTSQDSARARITNEVNPVRNPIGKNDQLFNVALSTGQKEHVAFAGIIDLDGDGRPNNEEFARILEKNNLIIDAYLDLKTGQIKKRGDGIDFRTKFLIIGSDAPLVGHVKTMIDQAKAKGVQLIDARMFLNLIGVKPPKNPAPPAYTTVTLGREGEKNVDPEAPMPPAAVDPKKN